MILSSIAQEFSADFANASSGIAHIIIEIKSFMTYLMFSNITLFSFIFCIWAVVTQQEMAEGINVLAIMSNDYKNHGADSPENMKLFAKKHGFPFAYLIDEDQSVLNKLNSPTIAPSKSVIAINLSPINLNFLIREPKLMTSVKNTLLPSWTMK
jgi:hypothetical protein